MQETVIIFKETSLSGQVPQGDVRLTANIDAKLHLQLKMYATLKKTTIGEVLENLISKHL